MTARKFRRLSRGEAVTFKIDRTTYRWVQRLSSYHQISDEDVVLRILEFVMCGIVEGWQIDDDLCCYGDDVEMEVALPSTLLEGLLIHYCGDSDEALSAIVSGVLTLVLNEYVEQQYMSGVEEGLSDNEIFSTLCELNNCGQCCWLQPVR